MKKKLPRPKKFSRRLVLKLLGTAFILILSAVFFSVAQVAALKIFNPPATVSVVWDMARSKLRSAAYTPPQYRWRRLAAISPHLQRAVLAAEDQRFFNHNGFDMVEIGHAAKDMLAAKRFRGASTITMQTARTVFLLPARSVARKALEAYYTVLIELLWDKKRILEVYLNTVDWGNDIMGAEAAAQAYFSRSAGDISRHQAARLAAILPNPHRFSPVRPNRYVRKRVKRILVDMRLMRI